VKQRTWIPTLVLIVIAGALAAYVFLVETKREPPPEPGGAPTPAPLWEFEGGDVTAITITQGEQTTAVERSDDGWRMTAPEAGEADTARLDSLANQAAEMKSNRSLADVDDVAAFGLEKPVHVTLVLTDGATIDFSIGSENPRSTDRYVQIADDPLIYLVSVAASDGLLKLLDEPPYPPTPMPPLEPLEIPTPTP
jgi:hypothetical protein